MSSSNPMLKRFGEVLFIIGMLLAFVLAVLMVWADVEAFSYGFPRVGYEMMSGLSCPQFMNRWENARFSLTLNNPTERELRPRVQVFVSESGFSRWRTLTIPFEISPGDRQTVTWETGAEDIVLGLFVLVKAYTYASFPQPNLEGSCGVFVVNLPWISGAVLFWLWLAASLILLAAGLWLSNFRNVEAGKRDPMTMARLILAALAVIGLLSAGMGWWPIALIILIITAMAFLALLFWKSYSL